VSVVILRGDARHLPLPDESVDLIVTSPPYFGLRSYTDGGEHYDSQIGCDATPAEYIASLLACTREWIRVLKPEGSIFVNLGDSYYSGKGAPGRTTTDPKNAGRNARRTQRSPLDYGLDLPRKTLLGMPWRYAIGCMDQLGLILRAEIVWAKPNGLPESVTDRVRRAHEQVFHFTRQPRYYSAVDEVREAHEGKPQRRLTPHKAGALANAARDGGWQGIMRTEVAHDGHPLGKLPGSVWEIPSQPLTVPAHLGVDHFAAFPMELPRRIILGWSPSGICTECGEGRRPAIEVGESSWQRRRADGDPVRYGDTGTGSAAHLARSLSNPADRAAGGFGVPARRVITGYACACPQPDAPARPAVVLDPFAGTGTTMLVASAYGRIGIGVDRSADYCRLATWRCSDPGERARALGAPKPPPVPEGQGSLFDQQEAV